MDDIRRLEPVPHLAKASKLLHATLWPLDLKTGCGAEAFRSLLPSSTRSWRQGRSRPEGDGKSSPSGSSPHGLGFRVISGLYFR